MEITRVEVKLNRDTNSKVKAFCKIIFDDSFVVNNIVVIADAHRENYFLVSYPGKFLNGGKRIDIVHPLTRDFSKYVEDKILDEFERVLNEAYNNQDSSLAEEVEAAHA